MAQPILYQEELEGELLLRGIPFDATRREAALYLASHGLDAGERDVTFCRDQKCRFNGRARIKWGGTLDELFAASAALHGTTWGHRYIEAFALCRGARTWCSAPSDAQFGQNPPKTKAPKGKGSRAHAASETMP